MPIPPYPNGGVFDPSSLEAMSTAFERACISQQVPADAHVVREVIAKRIMDLASRGERDPEKLKADALKALDIART